MPHNASEDFMFNCIDEGFKIAKICDVPDDAMSSKMMYLNGFVSLEIARGHSLLSTFTHDEKLAIKRWTHDLLHAPADASTLKIRNKHIGLMPDDGEIHVVDCMAVEVELVCIQLRDDGYHNYEVFIEEGNPICGSAVLCGQFEVGPQRHELLMEYPTIEVIESMIALYVSDAWSRGPHL